MKAILCVSFVSLALLTFADAADEKKLVVHEWGTFTSLQNEAGESLAGINIDDEPVPPFVHRLATRFFLTGSLTPPSVKGAPRCHPDVTMRLETPVIYFYPPTGPSTPPFDVRVNFNGGWLTEFYPAAEAKAPGFDAAEPDKSFPAKPPEEDRRFGRGYGHLRADARGELLWKGVTFSSEGAGPETTQPVWVTPRAVRAALLTTAGEREKFLFYRGVGHTEAALRVTRNATEKTLEVRDQPGLPPNANAPAGAISAAWLVEVKASGECAFRSVGAVPAREGVRAALPASFDAADFGADRLPALHGEMRAALIHSGLFADEADALLETWKIAYFKSPGLRFFYLCTPTEVDRLLPLQISAPHDLTRVLVGRIEIVTPQQRTILAKLGETLTVSSSKPEAYPIYLELGRFRNALVFDEVNRHPTPALKEFMLYNSLDPYGIE